MIGLRGVSYRYESHSPDVLSGVDLVLEAGTVSALLGPSGCGKSTLLYLCGLMLTPRRGTLTFAGTPVGELNDQHRSRVRARSIGFVFQDAMLDRSRSVLGNVIEGAVFTELSDPDISTTARRLLEEFGLTDRAQARVADLSGGQAQRVALCRALVKAPSVILADEPSGNLDRVNGDRVIDHLINDARDRGTTVLVVTHDDLLAARCDRIVSFEDINGPAATAS